MAAMLAFVTVGSAVAQDAVPIEMLERTKLIRVGNQEGTGFLIDQGGKIYLVTAKHIAVGLALPHSSLQVWQASSWENLPFSKLLLPASSDADIAVFETNKQVSKPFSVGALSSIEGMGLGQQVWFLGYPFDDIAMTGQFQNKSLPFVKRGTFSAVNNSDPRAIVLYIDGFNNPGFAGGPIVFWNFNVHKYQIAGVVKGYRYNTGHVLVDGKEIQPNVLLNSGILIGYSINHAMDAINVQPK
jgi:Trypsin-like peptidase domain